VALTDAHVDLIAGFQVMAQEFAISEGMGIAQEPRLASKILADDLEGAPR
jgi:hypothetical protein